MKVYCYCKEDFEEFCRCRGWNDSNVPEDWAFISICHTPQIAQNFFQDEDKHYFKDPHDNVLNLEFDDITCSMSLVKSDSGLEVAAQGITVEQATLIVEFIKKHVNYKRNFLIHCRAGRSRSQAIVKYITITYGEVETSKFNPLVSYNTFVLDNLKRIAKSIFENIRGTFIANGIWPEKFIVNSGLVYIKVLGKSFLYSDFNELWFDFEKEEFYYTWDFWSNLLNNPDPIP